MVQPKLFREHFYLLEDGDRVRQFLITGPEEALLIDTGFPDSHVADTVRTLTSAPVTVVLTHGDGDHTGGLGDFGACCLHRGDWDEVKGGVRLRPLREGDVFSCGGYRLEVIEIPGHTPGSIALLDAAHRLLIGGDSVQAGAIFMFGPGRNMSAYLASMRRLDAMRDRFDTVLASHAQLCVDAQILPDLIEGAQAYLDGKLTGVEPGRALPCLLYTHKRAKFLCR